MNLHIYQRGYFPRGTLHTLWSYVEHDKAAPKLFYAQPPQDSPESIVGDLAAFVGYFEDPKRVLLIVEEQNDVMGMVWFDDIFPGHRAAVNAFYRRRYWGQRSRQATRQAMRVAFDGLKVESLWAYTPWPEAMKHAQACGMKIHATLRGFAMVNGALRDLAILRMEKGDVLDG